MLSTLTKAVADRLDKNSSLPSLCIPTVTALGPRYLNLCTSKNYWKQYIPFAMAPSLSADGEGLRALPREGFKKRFTEASFGLPTELEALRVRLCQFEEARISPRRKISQQKCIEKQCIETLVQVSLTSLGRG